MAEKAYLLAHKAQGRIVHTSIDVTLIPPPDELGETDDAGTLSRLLVDGALQLLRKAAVSNGYKIEIECVQVIY
jgi:hypothetical protein